MISDQNLNKTYKNDSFFVHLRSKISWDQITLVLLWDSSIAFYFDYVLLLKSDNGGRLSPKHMPQMVMLMVVVVVITIVTVLIRA